MQNISPEVQEAFTKENGMSPKEAISHIGKWIEEKNFSSAEAGIAEIKKFMPDIPELEGLEQKLRAQKSSEVETTTEKAEKIKEVDTSNLEDVSKSEKFISALGYFGYLAVLPLAMKPNSEYCKYHGKQALLLAIVFTVLSAIGALLPGGLGLMSLLHLGLSIYGFIQAKKGKLWNMPIFGELARKLPID
jgi:uncharacterized membrane protein